MQYSVNQRAIQEFNNTIQDIQYNENLLKSKILQLQKAVKDQQKYIDFLSASDIFNQLIVVYSTILNTFQDIENSITFCKLKTLHPSVIKTNDLFLALRNISQHYKNQLPFELKYQNIFDFESIITINCKIEPTRINYFISVPIDYEKQFDLFYLLPIPTKYESAFVTVIPNVKYFLKSNDNVVKPLSDMCTQSKVFHCSNRLQINHRSTCEEEILANGTSTQCKYTKLNIMENHMEIIPEISQYLGVFPHEEKLTFNCDQQTETKHLHGIYLIKRNNCTVIFQHKQLSEPDNTNGVPILMDNLQLKLQQQNHPDFQINLKKLDLKGLPINQIVPIPEETINYHIPSIWTAILYLGITATGFYFLMKRVKNRNTKGKVPTPNMKVKKRKIQLPEEASF